MRTPLLLLFTLLVLFTGCLRNSNDCTADPTAGVDQTQLQIDIANIDEYLAAEGIEAQIHPSGIRYVIKREGDGAQPNACSTVSISYTGNRVSDEGEFDSSEGQILTWPLQNLIKGWQIGVPLIKEGGRITLYIPSVYAYGITGQGSIPPNESLIFEILLFGAN